MEGGETVSGSFSDYKPPERSDDYLDESSTGGTGEEKTGGGQPPLPGRPAKKSAGPPTTQSLANAAIVLHQQKAKKQLIERMDSLKKPLIPKPSAHSSYNISTDTAS